MDGSFLSRLLASNGRRTFWEGIAILIVWSGLVLYQASVHVMWRDEVRALSIALSGDDLKGMFGVLHGEGHPALWYLLLRGAYEVFGTYAVLPGLAFFIAAATIALLVFVSPFPRLVLLLLVGSHCFLYEYSVMARNYGIAALLLFLIAALYRRWRDRGPVLGILLLLLANTNVIAAMMVGAFLLFWFLELLEDNDRRWTAPWKNFLVNSALATVGVVLCALTMLPTFNDAAAVNWSEISPVTAAFEALINPGGTTPGALLDWAFPGPLISVLLFSMTLILLPHRAAFIAALAGLLLLSLFSRIGALGSYRHALVWFVFYMALAWISWGKISTALQLRRSRYQRAFHYIGIFAFLFYLEFQLMSGVIAFGRALTGSSLESRSSELGQLLNSRPELKGALVIPEPEFIGEALPYYADNPLYFVRESRFGKFVRFSRSGKLQTDLGEILNVARQLRQANHLPVVIVITHRLKDLPAGKVIREGYNWTFSASEKQIADFMSAASLIAEFGPVTTNETFDVYLLR